MKKYVYIIIILGVIGVLALLFFYFPKKKTEVITSWNVSLEKGDKGPYGLHALYELIETFNPEADFVALDENFENLEKYDVPNQNDIYFYAGYENYFEASEWDRLLSFVYTGNTAFMSVESLPYYLKTELLQEVNQKTQKDSLVLLSLNEKWTDTYPLYFYFNDSVSNYNWRFIDKRSAQGRKILGQSGDKQVNFISLNWGRGTFYVHTTPLAFTNISIFDPKGLEYVEQVLSYLPEGNIIWDEITKYPLEEENLPPPEQSPLQFIFKYPPLLWAYFLFLSGLVLYLLFKSKRKTAVIAPKEDKSNTSMNFLEVISTLYFKQKNHKKLVLLKEKTFLHFLRDRYFIDGKTDDPKFIDKVANHSKIEKEEVQRLFNTFNLFKQRNEVDASQLMLLHDKIEYFYNNCL